VASVEEKVAHVHGQLYGGSVTSPRELQALQDDENSLKRHQSAVEDKVIEQMELAVPLDEQSDELAARRAALDADQARVAEELVTGETEIDTEVTGVESERAEVAASVDPDLLERYEVLRHDLGGIAVARLVGTNCGGCHLTLSAVELDRIRHQPDDAVVLCEECGRLLVR
jgi:predicted  nucleic acid-binding Zn-ribbon protein